MPHWEEFIALRKKGGGLNGEEFNGGGEINVHREWHK